MLKGGMAAQSGGVAAALDDDERARYSEVSARADQAGPILHSGYVAWILDPFVQVLHHERAWLLALSPDLRMTRCTELERGEADRVTVCRSRSCADVAAAALRSGEPWGILVHNHPTPAWIGGGAWPSNADAELTEAVGSALRRRSLGLLDHVILSHDQHWSFAEQRIYRGAAKSWT